MVSPKFGWQEYVSPLRKLLTGVIGHCILRTAREARRAAIGCKDSEPDRVDHVGDFARRAVLGLICQHLGQGGGSEDSSSGNYEKFMSWCFLEFGGWIDH